MLTKADFIIIPARNRRAVTQRCLARLHNLRHLENASVIVVDDGSTDGAPAMVMKEFPAVHLLQGDGNLWWTGGILVGMEYALARGARLIFWLNDDCLPKPGSLEALAGRTLEHGGFSGAICVDPQSGKTTYGGHQKATFGLSAILPAPNTGRIKVAALSGNLVCFPASICEKIGLPDALGLPQYFADVDYSLRARRAGFPVWLETDFQGESEAHGAEHASWFRGEVDMLALWPRLRSPKLMMSVPYFPRYLIRHFGMAGLLQFGVVYAKMILATALYAVRGPNRLRQRGKNFPGNPGPLL